MRGAARHALTVRVAGSVCWVCVRRRGWHHGMHMGRLRCVLPPTAHLPAPLKGSSLPSLPLRCSDPRWGRQVETFGEDPHLAASMAAAYVRGLQGPPDAAFVKVGATCKVSCLQLRCSALWPLPLQRVAPCLCCLLTGCRTAHPPPRSTSWATCWRGGRTRTAPAPLPRLPMQRWICGTCVTRCCRRSRPARATRCPVRVYGRLGVQAAGSSTGGAPRSVAPPV